MLLWRVEGRVLSRNVHLDTPALLCLCRTDTCTFSNYRIYPYHGVTYVRTDGKVSRSVWSHAIPPFPLSPQRSQELLRWWPWLHVPCMSALVQLVLTGIWSAAHAVKFCEREACVSQSGPVAAEET